MYLQTKHYIIERIGLKATDDSRSSSADYIICQSDALNSVYEDKLMSNGYRFLDRLLNFEIETNTVNKLEAQ